jgi:alginate O-acetyltransferase complex protein AlgJ
MTDTTLPAGGRSREQMARIEVGQTTVTPPVAGSLVAFFVLAIVGVLALEVVSARATAAGAGSTVWSKLARIPRDLSVAIQRDSSGRLDRVLAGNRAVLAGLSGFERALEDESMLGRSLRPPAQLLLSGWLGAGNERVYIGEDRWLFYRPDLEYLTGRPFLDPDTLQRRVASGSEWTARVQPDPRPAILEFARQLAARGITLILMPTPVKPGVHPEMLVTRQWSDGTLQNPSFAAFVEELRGQGVKIFDPGDVLTTARRSAPQYLATDTHWRPEAMELVAARLAAFVNAQAALPPVASAAYSIEEREVANAGDTVLMLDLPEGQQLYPRERVVISRVVTPDGAWRSDRNADVLVLGDSFSNIYSLGSMGWGDSAGLIEQLSYAMQRPVDRIVQNDDGAFAARELLQRAGQERLAGKRVVIWQFAARELAFGDWKMIE